MNQEMENIIKLMQESIHKIDVCCDYIFDCLDASYWFLETEDEEIQREISKLYELIDKIKKIM